MKRAISTLIFLGCTTFPIHAQTVTPNIYLQVPAYNQPNWGTQLNYDLNKLDLLLSGNGLLPAINSAAYACNGSYGTNGQVLSTTGSACQWVGAGYPGVTSNGSGGLTVTGSISVASLSNANGLLLPSTVNPPTGNTSGAVELTLSGTTGTITGTALTATCDSGTATVTGAIVGRPVAVSSTTGADVGGAFNLRASVTSSGTVTVYVCGTGTPSSLAYNVAVL